MRGLCTEPRFPQRAIAAPIEVPAPSGQFRPLPGDWFARTLEYRSSAPSNILVEYIQKLVASQGEISIGIAEVQALAMTAAGAPGWSLDYWIETANDLVAAAGDDWPLRVCLDERPPETLDGFGASRALISIDAEWRVLRQLIAFGWRPIWVPRTKNSPDWRVERIFAYRWAQCCLRRFPWLVSIGERLRVLKRRTIEVDAKFKGSRGSCGVLLKRFLYGAALIGRGAVRSFDWSWEVSDQCRDKNARKFAAGLWGALPTLDQSLSQPLTPWTQYPLPESNDAISVTLEEDDKGRMVHVLRSAQDELISLTARPARFGSGIFVVDRASAGTEEAIDTPEAIATLDKIFGSLGMESQAAARAARQHPCIFTIVWPMPPTMEVADRDNLPSVWQSLSDANGWPPAVLWPTGFFEGSQVGWLPNKRALAILR